MKYIIMLMVLTSCLFGQVDSLEISDSLSAGDSLIVMDTVKPAPTVFYITSYDSTELAGINTRISDSLRVLYHTSCTEYSRLIRHPDRPEWALELDRNDTRHPEAFLSDVERPRLMELPRDWSSLHVP